MSKQKQLRLYGLGVVLLVVLMAGVYAFGSLSNPQVLAAQVTTTPAADDHQPDSMRELSELWETMQEHRQHGMDMPMAESMEQIVFMLEQMQHVMSSASEEEKQAIHGSMAEMMQGMMAMAGEMMDQMAAMPAEELQVHTSQMLEMMLGMMNMMGYAPMSGMGATMDPAMPLTGTLPMIGTMPMTGTMSMDGMDMDSIMGDMQGMMAQMQSMMEEMHSSLSIDEMTAMMAQMDKMMSMIENMPGMMGAETAPAQSDTPEPSAEALTQSAEAGAVTVKVTPLNLSDAAAETLDFTVVLDTHSVDLGVDLAEIALLQINDGEVAATAWEAPVGGHHVEGVLRFPTSDEAGQRLLEDAESVTLVIRDLAEVNERVFTWDLTSAATMETAAPAMFGHGGHGSASSATEVNEAEEAGHGAHGGAIPSAGVPVATENVGGQPLTYTEEEGVKVFGLTARPVRWTILEGEAPVVVTAWSYNDTVPGPMIRVTEGDRVRIVLQNDLPEATSIHWHGIPVPNEMDGMEPIQPGESFAYEFTAPPAGSFMYHSHVETDKQIMVGLYAPLIVDPAEPEDNPPAADVMWMLSEWRIAADGETYPAMPMAGGEPNYFTINGKAYPDTEPIVVKKGDTVRIRIAAIGQFAHPMHLHGMNFRIVGYDGIPLPESQQIKRNTVPVNPGEVIDIEFTADNVGTWVFHCHVLHHLTNDGVEPGGLIGIIQVVE